MGQRKALTQETRELATHSATAPAAAHRLRRLAADAGIVGVMRRHRWRVPLLSELPPEGYVGVSPVCILGLNHNRGEHIQLRLRTDDLRGEGRSAGWLCLLGVVGLAGAAVSCPAGGITSRVCAVGGL